MSNPENTPAPLFALPPRAPTLKIGDIVRDIAASGIPEKTARSRAKIYTQVRKGERNALIHPRPTGNRTAPFAYEFTDSAVAVALSALQDAGVQDHEVLERASSALYFMDLKAKERDEALHEGAPAWVRHPIDRALAGIATGCESWSLVVTIYRSPNTPVRFVDADLVPMGMTQIPSKAFPKDAAPVASIVVVLDQLLSPVLRRLMPEDRN